MAQQKGNGLCLLTIWSIAKRDRAGILRRHRYVIYQSHVTFTNQAVDRDGTLDMVFPSCNSGNSDCYINIAYNEQVPLCIPGPLNLKECRDANDLCVSDPNFKFDLNAESSVRLF